MKIAILSDIHANRYALQAVLEDSSDQKVEKYWCLGDLVGYGSDPVTPLLWAKHFVASEDWVLGNHEVMLAYFAKENNPNHYRLLPDLMRSKDWDAVNKDAQTIIRLNLQQLERNENEEAHLFWQSEFKTERIQPKQHVIDGISYWLVHSGQFDPLYRYIYSWEKEIHLPDEFSRLRELHTTSPSPVVQCYGHTHVPTMVYAQKLDDKFQIEATPIFPNQSYSLTDELTLINPGSVGQPRDMQQGASYAILDTELKMVTFRRVTYDWRLAAYELQEKDYPNSSAIRLVNPYPTETTPIEWRNHYQAAKGKMYESI